MIKAKLVIENHTRDYFCEEFTDEFELVAIENRTDDYELRHNECRVTTLNKEQLQELKEMLDDGLITQEDFEQKKKQILGL